MMRNDPTYLREEQYRTDANLAARQNLHARYSTHPQAWFEWLFERLDVGPTARILELGCGAGWLWEANRSRIPDGWEVTLSDFSPGMLASAEARLREGAEQFAFELIDAASIPFAAAAFDGVIANHMLYHVPDRPAAIRQMQRVLAPGGRLFAATNGLDHLSELWRLGSSFGLVASRDVAHQFTLENGAAQLAPFFHDVQCERYEDALEVTRAEDLVAYVLSAAPAPPTADAVARLSDHVATLIATHGSFHITKSVGLFTATR
ncbi:MAG: class I SAM-dependent methyltransferase [Chloroflexota bacterium]